MEQRLGRVGVGPPDHEGAAGRLAKLAIGLTAVGAAVLAARGRRSRAAAISGAALITGGAIAERCAVSRRRSNRPRARRTRSSPSVDASQRAPHAAPRDRTCAGRPTRSRRTAIVPANARCRSVRRRSTPGAPIGERDATPHRRRGVALAQRARRALRRLGGRSSRSRAAAADRHRRTRRRGADPREFRRGHDGAANPWRCRVLAKIELREDRRVGERVGSPLTGGYVPSAGGDR